MINLIDTRDFFVIENPRRRWNRRNGIRSNRICFWFRKSFTNILRWWNLKDESLCLSMDYVHNICSNGWSMGTIGTTVYNDSIHLQSSFMPLCYSFARSESSVPYQAALSQVIMVIHLVTGIPTEKIKSRILFAQGDDAGAIKKAA